MNPVRLFRPAEMGLYRKALIWLAVLLSLGYGLGALYTSIFSDFRAHLRPVVIPLAPLSILFAIGLANRLLVCILLLFLSALLGTILSAHIQIDGGELIPVFGVVFVVGLLYVISIGSFLWRTFKS